MILPIDEIRSIPYKEYFGIMELTEKQKKDRISFAEELEDELLLMYELLLVDAPNRLVVERLKQSYEDIAKTHQMVIDDYVLDVIDKFATDFVRVTKKHTSLSVGQDFTTDDGFVVITAIAGSTVTLNEYKDDGSTETYEMPYNDVLKATSWYVSPDRAVYNAENEANTALNYKDYTEATKRYSRKTWKTENDDRVRPTHIPLEGVTVSIDDLFEVGGALMRFPKDIEYCDDATEICNCRCSIKYS